MKKATSFIGEHTVEFTIVPILKEILKQEYEFVTPIFPWMTREGASISRYLHQYEKFKVIGLYPRRPKITKHDKESIYLKINNQIIQGAKSGVTLGIPIIAGYPIVKNFWELGQTPRCLWIKLDFESNENFEFQIKLDKTINLNDELSRKVFHGDYEILRYFNHNAKFFNINEMLEAFRKIKMDSRNVGYYSSFAHMGGYKPVYFLVRND